MHFAGTLGKGSGKDGGTADVVKGTRLDVSVFDTLNIEGGGTQMSESAMFERDIFGMAHSNGADGAFHPCLILQSFVPR